MRRKWIYHHFVNNKEVTKEEFLDELQHYCMRCDTNYDNPLLNIGYVDTHLLKRKYDYHKCHPNTTTIYVNDNMSFRIKREERKPNEKN